MSNSTNTSKCKDPPLKRRKLEVQEELVATLIKSLTQIDSKGTNESSKEMFGCPMELRKPLLVEILEKEKPSLLRVALDHVIDLMQVAVKSKQTDSESPSSFLQDLLLIHKNIPYAEMILSERVASRIQLDATPEACLDILEEDTYNNSRLCRLFLLKHIKKQEGRYRSLKRKLEIQRRLAQYVFSCVLNCVEYMFMFEEWPEIIIFEGNIQNTFLHSIVSLGDCQLIIKHLKYLNTDFHDLFHHCRSARNSARCTPYAWLLLSNITKGVMFFEEPSLDQIYYSLGNTQECWKITTAQLTSVLMLSITNIRKSFRIFTLLRSYYYVQEKSLPTQTWLSLLFKAALVPPRNNKDCRYNPLVGLITTWPFLYHTMLKWWNPLTLEGPLHLIIRAGNLKSVSLFIERLSLRFKLENFLQDNQGVFYAPQNPLITAIRSGNTEMVELLLTKGKADPNGFDRTRLSDPLDTEGFSLQNTPLISCVLLDDPKRKEMISLLIRYGADINKVTTTGNSLLHALIQNQYMTFRALIDVLKSVNFDFTVESPYHRFNAFQALCFRRFTQIFDFIHQVPRLLDFSVHQDHPFAFTLRLLDEKQESFCRSERLLNTIAHFKKFKAGDEVALYWQEPKVIKGLQVWMQMKRHNYVLPRSMLNQSFLTLEHTLFHTQDIKLLIFAYIYKEEDQLYQPIDLMARFI